MCSLIHVAHVVLCVLVLVGVRGVTVVHIGHDEVLVVVLKSVAIFVVIFLYLEMYSLHPSPPSVTVNCVDCIKFFLAEIHTTNE